MKRWASSIKDLETSNRIGAVALGLMALSVAAMLWHTLH